MPHHRVTRLLRCRILLRLIATGLLALFINATPTQAQLEDSFEGFISGVRANAVKGRAAYQRKDGKFDLEAGLKLEEGDFIKTESDGYAELLLQPGDYLRIGSETDFQIFSEQHDKMRLKLNQGSISLEILAKDSGDFSSWFYSRAQAYELIRVITPNAQVFITEPGIFRINAIGGERTEVIVRDGEALINGRRVKEKRRAVAFKDAVTITELDTKIEDSFDSWGRERAELLVKSNQLLKNQSPWGKKHKEGHETVVDLPQEEDQNTNLYVVSAKPGAVNFVETGVEFSGPEKEWQQLTEKSQLETGDKLRTGDHSFGELTVLPDIHLRLDGASEVKFEQLSNETISLKLLRGSAILDVARFDRKQVPKITFSGPAISAEIADAGNYRLDIRPNSDEIIVREGKVIVKERSVGGCHRITVETVSDCDKKGYDNFDFWSQHRGEGELYNGRRMVSMVTHLAKLRRVRFRNTGFWFQNPGQPNYTFVPFSSTMFRSPYGGKYSTVLSPRRKPMNRIDMSGTPPFGRMPGPQIARPQP
jgi:hypothetical protein